MRREEGKKERWKKMGRRRGVPGPNRAVEEKKKEKREKKVKVSKNVNKQHKKLTKLELVESMVVVVMKRCSRGDAKCLMRGRDERG